MPALANDNGTDTPTPRSVDPAAYGPAPANVVVLSPSLDMAIVTTFRDIIRKAGTLANGRVYPAKDDAQFKSDLRYMRKHLAPTLTATERIKVNMYGEPGAISFYLSLATKKPRKANGTAKTPETAPTTTQTPATPAKA